jgi:hypothetical protein
MARKLRVEYPGAICHVLNRGDRREPIFRDNADRQRFVEAMLAQKQPRKLSGKRDYRNRPLSDAQKASGSASSAERAYGSEGKQSPEVQASRAHRTRLWLPGPADERILPALPLGGGATRRPAG